jgi:hypothetical protein
MAVDPNFNWVRSLVQGNSTENLAGTKWPTTVTGSTAGTDYLGLANGDLTVSNTEFAASDWDTRASPYRKQVRYQMVIEGTSPWVVGARVATGYDYTISNSASAGVLEVRTYQSSSSVATFQVPTSGAYTIEINESALPGGGNTGRVDIYYVVYVNRSEFQTGASAAFGLWDVGAAKYSSLSPYIKVGGASAANTLINSSEFTVVANIVVPGYRSAANAVLAKIPLHSEARSRTTTVSGSMPSVFTESVVLSGSKTWRIGAGTPTHPYFTATVNLAGMTETQGATVAAQSLAAQVAAAYPGLKVGGGAVRPYSDTYSFTQSGVTHSATTYWDNYYVDVPELSLTTPWPDPTVSATEIAYASGGVAGAFTDSPIGRYVENGQYGSGAGQLAVITFTFAGAPHADNGVAIRPIFGNTYTSVIAEVSSPTDAANFVANYIATEATSSIVTLGNSSTVTLTSRLPVNINQEMASVVAAGRRVPVVSGVSKLYGFRATVQAATLLPPVDLPWPTSAIPGAIGGAPDPNTLLLMHFDESSGTTLADDTGRTFSSINDLSVQTGAAGKFGRGLMPTSWTAAAGSSPVNLSGGIFTIEFWVTKTNIGSTGYEVVFAQTTSPDTWANGIVLFIDSTNGLAVAYMDGAPSNSSAAMSLTPGTWIHVALVRQGSGASQTKWYVNGTGSAGFQSSYTYASTTPTIGNTVGQSYNLGYVGIDELRISDVARYTANFTPPTAPFDIGGGGGPTADVTGAGYNDIEELTSFGTGNTQATDPDSYGISATDLDDFTVNIVAYIDAADITGTGTTTLAAFTNVGDGVAAIPTDLTGDPTGQLDDFTSAADGVADFPLEFTADYTLGDITSVAVGLFLAPSEGSGDGMLDDIVQTTGEALLIDPVVYSLNATVPVATLVFNTTQFFVNATVPAATLSAEVSQYEGFKLDGAVPAASMAGWFGMRLNRNVPWVTLLASGSVPNTLRLSVALPRVTIQANILDGRKFNLNARLPVATLSAWTGWQLAGTVPAATVQGNIVVGGAYTLIADVPKATLMSSISTVNVLSMHAVVPAAARAGWLALSCNVPAARLLARSSAVQAITRVAYSFTLANSAMTRYPAYPFVQLIRMGNAYYGVADDGLYEIGGETDNGTSIPWAWETCMTDFGVTEKKTVVSAYLGGYVPQSMTYTIKAGDVPTGANAHATTATAVLRNHRQKFGIGRKSRFFAFGLSATQGRVAIESIEFEVANMSRRV